MGKVIKMRPRQRPTTAAEQLELDLQAWINAQANRHGDDFDRDWQLRKAYIRAFDRVGRGIRLRDIQLIAENLRAEALARSQLSITESSVLGPGWVKAFRRVWLDYWRGSERQPGSRPGSLLKLRQPHRPEPDGVA